MLTLNKIHQGDCMELLKEIKDQSIDMIFCDLPYGVTHNEWDKPLPLDQLWIHYKRIIKPAGIIILTATQPFATDLINLNREWFRYDLIFEKTTATGFLNAKKMPLRSHELILVFYEHLPTYNPIMVSGSKSNRKQKLSNGANYGALTVYEPYNSHGWRYPKSVIRISNGNRTSNHHFHPTGKPIELLRYLIKTYTNEGDLILDNCIGAGTTAVAAKQLGRNFIGMELSSEYVAIANKRLSQDVLLASTNRVPRS